MSWTFLRSFVAAVMVALVPAGVAANEFPNRPIKVVVPFAAAGVTDVVARVVFDQVSRAVGQTIFVENRPGAGGTIGVEQVVERAARRLHADHGGPVRVAAGERHALPTPEISPDSKPCPDRHLRHHGCGAADEQRDAGAERAGTGRAGEEEAGRAHIRIDGRRDARAPQWRVVLEAGRHSNRACAVSRGRAGRHGPDGWAHFILDRADPDHAAEHSAGSAPRAGGRGRFACRRSARHPDHQGDRHR